MNIVWWWIISIICIIQFICLITLWIMNIRLDLKYKSGEPLRLLGEKTAQNSLKEIISSYKDIGKDVIDKERYPMGNDQLSPNRL